MTDLEQALAEALHYNSQVWGKPTPCEGWSDDCDSCVPASRAILATEPMQALARQAAIGAAVMRAMEGHCPNCGMTAPHACPSKVWFSYEASQIGRAAIAAALGDDDE